MRDVFDLIGWVPGYPEGQILALDDGFYHITLGTSLPPSGYYADNQVIDAYLKKLARMPALKWPGVPFLGDQTEFKD